MSDAYYTNGSSVKKFDSYRLRETGIPEGYYEMDDDEIKYYLFERKVYELEQQLKRIDSILRNAGFDMEDC